MKKKSQPNKDDYQRDAKKLKNWYAKTYEKLIQFKKWHNAYFPIFRARRSKAEPQALFFTCKL